MRTPTIGEKNSSQFDSIKSQELVKTIKSL
jgi:hypothetical protein